MSNYMSYTKMFLVLMAILLAVLVYACSDEKNISAPDITSPGVSSTSPADAATGVAVNSIISVLFNEDINPESLNTETFLVQQGNTPVLGTVTYAGKTVTFTPVANLKFNMLYTATITSVRDLPGNVIASNVVWNFTTGAAPDTTKPAVLSSVPLDAATGVSINSNLTAIFSEAMDGTSLTTATVTVTGPGGTPVTGTVAYAGASKSVVFTPAANLAANTTFTATITTAVKDPAGNTLAQNYTWNFTTGAIPDITAPTVTSTAPVNAATNVAINSKLNVTFSEAMDPLTINTATVTLRKGTTAIIGTLTYSGTTTTFTPSAPLDFNSTYIAAITTGAKDLAGNALPGNFIWSFSTGAIPDNSPPSVVSTIPVNAATGVAISSKLTAVFSEAMDPLTLTTTTFMVKGPGVTPVTGTVVYDVPSQSVIFTPAGTLAANTLFTATITTGAVGQHGNVLAGNVVWTFTTGATPDITKPAVLSTIPVNAATGVAISSKLFATFSEAIDPLTLTTATVTLRRGSTPVIGTLTYSGTTVNFTPVGNLASNTLYSAMITTGVKDLAGNALAGDFAWSFTTGIVADTTKPIVLSTSPLEDATNVSITSKLTAEFSELMDPLTFTTATFTVQGPGETPVTGSVVYAASSNSVTFTPSSRLVANTLFTATLTTGVKDLEGNALAGNFVWRFTTGATPDITIPTVLSNIPVDAATGVSITSALTAAFSEALDPSTITAATFTLRQGTTPVVGALTYSGTTAFFKPTGDLLFNTVYTATLTTGVRDLAGNALAGNVVWTFTTGATADSTPPAVVTTVPAHTTAGVAVNTNITAYFSEAMDPSTITSSFTVQGPGVTPVAGIIVYNIPGMRAIFTPAGNLAYNTLYTATMTTGAKDLAGNALAGNVVWSFTTLAAPDTTKPTVLSTIPVQGATGVAITSTLTAAFSEAMNASTITGSFTVQGPGLTPVTGTVAYDVPSMRAVFTPAGNLAQNTLYTATITTGAMDLAGNALAGNVVWSFTTAAGDTTRPTVVSTIPLDNADGVSNASTLTAVFSEAMNPSTLTAASFKLQGPGDTPVTGTVVYDIPGMRAVFTPSGTLVNNTLFAATITTGATDLAGNALAGNFVWFFTTGAPTDTIAPSVASTIPVQGATGVAITSTVTAVFNEAMNASTVTASFTLKGPGVTPVAGSVAYDVPSKSAVFTPSANLAYSTLYTATMTTGAKDLGGNALPSNFVWTFTTGAAPVVINLATAGNFAILAGSAITNTATSFITGNVGVYPTDAISGLTGADMVSGSILSTVGDAATLITAKADLVAAYDSAAAKITTGAIAVQLGGTAPLPGVYSSASGFEITTGNLTLNGTATDVWIFQMPATTLTVGIANEVILGPGVLPNNVYWQVGSSATLGSNSKVSGNILAFTSIDMHAGATLNGRALARNGAVTIITSTITKP